MAASIQQETGRKELRTPKDSGVSARLTGIEFSIDALSESNRYHKESLEKLSEILVSVREVLSAQENRIRTQEQTSAMMHELFEKRREESSDNFEKINTRFEKFSKELMDEFRRDLLQNSQQFGNSISRIETDLKEFMSTVKERHEILEHDTEEVEHRLTGRIRELELEKEKDQKETDIRIRGLEKSRYAIIGGLVLLAAIIKFVNFPVLFELISHVH